MSFIHYGTVNICELFFIFNQYLLLLQFVVHEVLGQDLEVDLYDADPDKDDFMGR